MATQENLKEEQALEAIDTEIAAIGTALVKITQVINRKLRLGEDIRRSARKRARLNKKLSDAEDRREEIEAADVIVEAPTFEEMDEVQKTIQGVAAMAVTDASLNQVMVEALALAKEGQALGAKVVATG